MAFFWCVHYSRNIIFIFGTSRHACCSGWHGLVLYNLYLRVGRTFTWWAHVPRPFTFSWSTSVSKKVFHHPFSHRFNVCFIQFGIGTVPPKGLPPRDGSVGLTIRHRRCALCTIDVFCQCQHRERGLQHSTARVCDSVSDTALQSWVEWVSFNCMMTEWYALTSTRTSTISYQRLCEVV